ncbi:metal-sensitive transcriptional regulator [Timonella sp. A28]|uniref:metal-sensitive transcriptional regulator n=1 Tax=Timonella sp. A28 TaxID=3442640 RepID=UPI003EBF2E17
MDYESPEAAAARKRIVNRLKRANGQLTALIANLEGGAGCKDVVTQLSAVSSALDKAGFAIISSAMKDCVMDPEGGLNPDGEQGSNQGLTLDELEKLFLTLS